MSELLKKAAQDVADAWNVPGPSPVDHWDARTRLAVAWPTLANAVERLAELLEPDWEYNIETTYLDELYRPTGKVEVRGLWSDSPDELEKGLVNLRKQAEWEAQGPALKTFKIVKRRKPEGYVDA